MINPKKFLNWQISQKVKNIFLERVREREGGSGGQRETSKLINTGKKSVPFEEPTPLRRLTRGLSLTSNPKDGIANSKNKFHELVCDCLSHRYDNCRESDFGPSDAEACALTTRPSCYLLR